MVTASIKSPFVRKTARFEERKHPRADDGKFGQGGGGAKDSGGSAEGNHRIKADAVIGQGLVKVGKVNPAIAKKYKAFSDFVVKNMTSKAIERFNDHCEQVKFFATNADLDAEHKSIVESLGGDATASEGMAGFFDTETRALHLAGSKDVSGKNFNSLIMADMYAHEFSHAIDGSRGQYFSDSDEWKAAWKSEIDTDNSPLSAYARQNVAEGFAEFGRLVLTSLKQEASKFPKCFKFWKDRGLV